MAQKVWTCVSCFARILFTRELASLDSRCRLQSEECLLFFLGQGYVFLCLFVYVEYVCAVTMCQRFALFFLFSVLRFLICMAFWLWCFCV